MHVHTGYYLRNNESFFGGQEKLYLKPDSSFKALVQPISQKLLHGCGEGTVRQPTAPSKPLCNPFPQTTWFVSLRLTLTQAWICFSTPQTIRWFGPHRTPLSPVSASTCKGDQELSQTETMFLI